MGFLEKIYVALIKRTDGTTTICWSLHATNTVQKTSNILRDDPLAESATIYEVNADELITTSLTRRFDAGYFTDNEELKVVKWLKR